MSLHSRTYNLGPTLHEPFVMCGCHHLPFQLTSVMRALNKLRAGYFKIKISLPRPSSTTTTTTSTTSNPTQLIKPTLCRLSFEFFENSIGFIQRVKTASSLIKPTIEITIDERQKKPRSNHENFILFYFLAKSHSRQ